MHIMADLGREILLFTIKYRSHDGLLLIYPDFNSIDANPYLKEIVSDSRHLYQYAIQNISVDLGSDDDWPLKDDIEMMANKVCWTHDSDEICAPFHLAFLRLLYIAVTVIHQIANAVQPAAKTVHPR